MRAKVWDDIEAAMLQALRECPNAYARAFPQYCLAYTISGGDPGCQMTDANNFGTSRLIRFQVRNTWMEEVHGKGMAMLDGEIVLAGAEATPIEGAERAWIVTLASVVHDTDRHRIILGHPKVLRPQLLAVVEYGGMFGRGWDQTQALDALREGIKKSMLPEENSQELPGWIASAANYPMAMAPKGIIYTRTT